MLQCPIGQNGSWAAESGIRPHLGIRASCLASTSLNSRRQSLGKKTTPKITWRSDHISFVSRISHQHAWVSFQLQSQYSAPASSREPPSWTLCLCSFPASPHGKVAGGSYKYVCIYIVGDVTSGIEWLGPGEQILNPTGSSRINFRATLAPDPTATAKGVARQMTRLSDS
jgi:hypothetical protein